MNLLRTAALRVPAIRRLRDARDGLLVERDRLLARTDASARECLEASDMRTARADGRIIVTEYPYYPKSRLLELATGGQRLQKWLRGEHEHYAKTLQGIARHLDAFLRIPRDEDDPNGPYWANDWFPPLDGVSLYGLIADAVPHRYIEVGSGISTRFARCAVRDLNLPTRIVSIDPHPHTAIRGLCDEVVQSRMEDVPREFWDGIGPQDMLFLDNSHRSFPNSDVTVFFSEVLPGLPRGTIWGLHDILLPWDYPQAWSHRFYNEQYLLLAYLIGGADGDEILLPARWASSQPALHDILAPLWAREDLFQGVGTHGGCFWMRRGSKQPAVTL